MSLGGELLVALVIAVGLVGVVIPVLPGLLLSLAAIGVWAYLVGGAGAWTVLAVAAGWFVAGSVVKYVVPSRRLRQAGVPWSSTVAGGVLGVVGFFVVPVVGLVLGFVVGVYLAEWRRLADPRGAWASTRHALAAAGWSMAIEGAAGLLMALTWLVGVLAT